MKQRLIRTLLGLALLLALVPSVSALFGESWYPDWLSARDLDERELEAHDTKARANLELKLGERREVYRTNANDIEKKPPGSLDLTIATHDVPETSITTGQSPETNASITDQPAADPSEPGEDLPRSDESADTPEPRSGTAPPTSESDNGTSSSPNIASTSITGTACPCTVTDTVELKGEVSLTGDLVVTGGTLVARPGVKVEGNGFQIMFMDGGRADFQGSAVSTWSESGKQQNLERDITFRNLRRIVFHSGAGPSILKYFTVSGSGTSALGDYPLHWHLNGDSTRGTLVEGVVVLNGRHHAFVPHGSHGITFRDTIAKGTAGDAYWWDPGGGANCSNDISYQHALADHVINNPGDNRGFRLSAFRLGCGKGNEIRDSVALNVDPSHPKDCSGFHWPEEDQGVWRFLNNASYGSACNGIFIWQNTSDNHVINGYRGDPIENGAYLNRYKFYNIDVTEVEGHALGRDDSSYNVLFQGGAIGTLRIPSHVLVGGPMIFRDLEIGSAVVDNASNGGDTPGTYVFENTNLTCDAVTYRSVVAGTRVIVDGENC